MPEIDNESRRWLYQTLTSPEYGLNLGTPQEFDSLVSNNEESRRWLWDQANSLGLNVGANYEEFDSLINPRVDVSDVQQAEAAAQPVTEVAAQPSQQPVSAPTHQFQPMDYSPRPVVGAQTEPAQPSAPQRPFQPTDYSPRPAEVPENQSIQQSETTPQPLDTVAQQPQDTAYMPQDTASTPQDTVTQPQETPMEAGKPRTVSDIVSDFEQRHHLKEARERIYGSGRAPITVKDGKTGYNFSPENVEAMRGYQEQAWEAAFNEVQSLMPEIERSVREKALFDTEQNNRNKDAKQEDLQWHADRLAEQRIKFIKEKLEEGGIGKNGLDFSKDSTLNMLSFGDKELRERLAAAYRDKSDIDGYMEAYYRTPEGKSERINAVNNTEASLQAIKERRSSGFWKTVGAMFGDLAISGAIAEGGMDRQSQQQLLKVQDDIRKTASVNMATNQQLHEAENTLGIVKKNIEEGEGNAFVKFGRGVRYSNLDNLIPVSELYGQMGILQLYDKLDSNGNPKEPLTEEEQNLYNALAMNQYVQQVFGGDVNMLNRIGRGLPEQAEFTLQFLLSSEFAGAQAVGKGATNALRRGIGNTIKKEIKSGIGRFMLDKALPTAFGMGAETLYRTGLQLPSIMAGGIERHVGKLRIDPETGEVGGFEGGVDWGEALWKSTLSVANENLTELLGDQVFQPGWEWLGRNTKAGAVLSDFREGLGKLGNNRVDDWLKAGADIRRKAGWSGNMFEFAEEMAGSFNDAAFIHDQTWGEAFSKESIMETYLNCLLFGVVMGTTTSTIGSARNLPSTIGTRNEKRKAASIIDRMDGISTAEIDEHIDNSTSNELADWLVQMHRNGNANGDWTDTQRAAVANYVRASVEQKAQRHFKGMKLQEDVKAMEATADDMVNNQSGDIINANFTVDGQQMTGTIVGGRVSAVEDMASDADGNPKKAFIYNPNLSSVTLTVRLEDGTKKQIPARDVTSINDIVDAEQFKAERAAELQGEMQRSVADMNRVTTASDVWSKVLGGGTLQAGMMLPYDGGIVRFDGKDADGNWLVTTARGEQLSVNDFEFRKMGMVEGLRMLQQQQAPQEEIDDAIDDIDTEDTLHNIEQSDNEDNIWDDIAGFMQGYTKTNEEGDFIPEESRPEAAAGYLVALQKGDIAKTIDIVNERIAELQTRLGEKPQGVQNNGEGVVGMAANQSLADSAAEDIQKQIDFLTAIRDGLVAKQQEKAEMDAMKPVSQMEVGQSFPVVWQGQPATANVVMKDADGRSVVSVVDENGEPLEVGIDDWNDEQWEAVRSNQQEEENSKNTLVKVGDRVDVDWGNGTTETVTVRGIEGDLVLITTSDGKPYDFPIGWLSSGQARVSNNSVEITPTPQGPAPAEPAGMEAQPQPVSQNETPEPTSQQTPTPVQPEAAPQQEQPQAEYPKDKQGKPQYDMIDDPNVFLQALVDEWGEDALGALDDIIEDTEKDLEQKSKLEQRRINKRLAMLEAVRGMMQPQEEISGNQGGISPNTTVEEVHTEQPTGETSVEQPVAETPHEKAPKEEVPSETPTESAVEGAEQEAPAAEATEETPSAAVETPIQKPKQKKQTDFQQRLDAVGEPRSLEEAILLDIARGGAKFRWGNRDEDKTVTKRGIGDLWKYSQSEFKMRIGILRKDGYSIETYAEAIQAGQLAYLGGHVSQLAERMDMRDLVDAIEDVLHFATSATEALEAIETKRNEEAEEEQRMIQNAMDSEAKEQGFENRADKEAYIKSLEENNLTDADYEEITRIFAEQYQEDEQRRRTSESEGDSGENQPDERQGVRGADEGSAEVLQGTQAADTGTTEPAGQGTRGESGDIQDAGTPGKNEGAREVRAEIDKLKAQRANLVKQLNDIQKRYENANGLFGDTQADEGDLFGGQNFLSPELAQTTIDGYNRQIKQIDEQIAKLEASLKRAEEVKQTEIGETVEVVPEDVAVESANPADTETKVEKGLTEAEIDAAEVDNQTKLLAKEFIKGNKNDITKDAYEEVREYYAERGRNNPEQDGGTASGTQLAAADNEAQDQRGGGQRGVEPGRVDQGASEETVSGDGGRGENGAQRTSASAGEQGSVGGNGEQPGAAGQPVTSGVTEGSGRSGGNGLDVRQPRGEKKGGGVYGEGAERGDQASGRRSTDEIDKDIADDLAEIGSLFKREVPRSEDESSKPRNKEVELEGPRKNESAPEEPQAVDPKWFRSVRKAIFKLAGHVFERGYNQFDEWKNKIKDLLHSAIKNFRDKLSDERLDQLLADAWDCPFEYNGEVKTIREWASELHAQEVRKMLNKSLAEKRKEQAEANKKGIKQVHGDIENIKATLPFLLPHQQENVARAERQFFSEEHSDREHGFGKGYLFTDGTGTGKTFTGLGIVRRFVNEGKGRVLILTTKTKVNDWVDDAAKLGIEASSLEAVARREGKTPTRVKGSGVVVTTYANASQNLALLEDAFDLVVYDESHYIMNNKGGEETISTKTHYMLTNKNIESALNRLQAIHPLWIKENELVEERQRMEEVLRDQDASYQAQKDAQERISQIDGLLRQLKSMQNAELPAMREKAIEAAKKTKAVFLSATPFKTIDNLEYAEGYIFSYPEEDETTKGSSDHRSGKDEFKLRHFGSMYRWRHHQIEEHMQNLDAAVQQQQAFADRLMNTLETMSGCVLDNGYDYSRHFPLVEVAMADQFNEAVEALGRDPQLRVIGEYFPFNDYNKMSVLFETMKVSAALPRIKEHLKAGRKVVIFNRRTNYPQPTATNPNPWTPQNPFMEGLVTALGVVQQGGRDADAIKKAVELFKDRYASLIMWAEKLDYRLPSEQLKDVFGDQIEIINGNVTGKKRGNIIDKFNKDEGGIDILLGQERTMREGISIHDTTGKKQRVIISLALPQETTTFIQGEGRIYRIGNQSNAIFEYPLLGINRELTLFALNFNAAVGMTENLAMGSNARNLARSIAKGVIEDSGVVPLEGQGIGGREKDYGKSTRDAYSAAINDYYSTQKQKSGREGRLGEDYYATPEPLGFKMVQWLNLAEGEDVLEPSAGHGAIARYFPGSVRSLAIEPSQALFSLLALNTGGVDRDNAAQASGKNRFVQNGNFEDLAQVNKYDAIGMNPPFGHAGATAIEHLEMALGHLRNSGRIAIIVPTGAMDKKIEDWLAEHKNAVVVGEIKLPSVTFEKAGTNVSTRLLIIDRVDRASFRAKVASKKVTLDMTSITNIDEFFRELRDVDMPSRMIDPATKLLRHGDAMRAKLTGNDIVDYRENPQTRRRSKNMGKDIAVSEDGVRLHLNNGKDVIKSSHYLTQSATWNQIKKLKGSDGSFFTPQGYVLLSDIARCETMEEAKEQRLIEFHAKQEDFENAKEFAETMTDFIRRVSGFTDEQIRDYNNGIVDLFDYSKIKDNAQLTFSDLVRLYEDMEQDPMLQALFERVSTIAERIGMKIETFNDPFSNMMGSYNPLTNTLRINSGRWNNTDNDSVRSQTILHELIHSVTTYALNAYQKGQPMSDGLKDACRRTIEIFENIKGDYPKQYGNGYVYAPSGVGRDAMYGFTDPQEMLAEMANPAFRKYLQKRNLWTKLKDGIKRILNMLGLQNLGIKFPTYFSSEHDVRWYGDDRENVDVALKEGWKATNAFDELSETLDMFMDNFDAALYERRNDGIVRAKIVDTDEQSFTPTLAENEIAEEVNRKTGATKKAVSWVVRKGKEFWRNWTDYARPIQQMQEVISKAIGRKLRDSEDVFNAIYRMPNVVKSVYGNMEKIFMRPLKNAIGRVIEDLGSDFDSAYDAVSRYMIAKHGLERNEWFYQQELAEFEELKKDTSWMSAQQAMYDALPEKRKASMTFEQYIDSKKPKKKDKAGLSGLAQLLGMEAKDFTKIAERVVSDFENEVDADNINGLWQSVNAITDALLDMEYESGLTDKAHRDELKAGGRWKYYVPLRGFNSNTSGDYFDYDEDLGMYSNPIKSAKGRKSMSADPMGQIAELMQQVILASEKNKVGTKFYNLTVNSRSDLLRLRDVWMEKSITGEWREVSPDIPEGTTPAQVAEILKQFDADMRKRKAEGEKVKKGTNKLDLSVDSSIDGDTKVLPYNKKKHEVLVYVNGKPKVIYVNGNPEIARVMNEGARKVNADWLKPFFFLTRLKAQLNTTFSPLFPFRNTPRDMQFLLRNAFIMDGAKGWLVANRNMARALRAVPRLIATEYWSKNNTANLGKLLHSVKVTDIDGNVVETLKGKDAAERILQWWNEFLDNGGETGMIKTLSAEQYEKDLRESIKKLMDGGGEDGESVLNKLTLGGLEQISRISEDISRFAAYAAYRSTGHSIHQSATFANNATLNFQKKGGGNAAAVFRGLFPFLNARIRGLAQMFEIARDGDIKQRVRFGSVLAMDVAKGYIVSQLTALLLSLFGGDDDDDENGRADVWDAYEFLSQYKGNNNLILYLPWTKKFATIPMPQEYAPFLAIGNIAFRERMGWNYSQSMAGQIVDMFLGQSPIEISEGGTAGGRLVRTLWPGGTKEIAEVIFNENFMGNQIWYDTPYNQSDANWTKAKDSTPKFLVDLSKWLNGGYVKPKNEFWDRFNNPALWWHLMKGAAGGLGRTGEYLFKTVEKVVNGESFGIEDIPGLRAWFIGSEPDDYKYGIINAYQSYANDFYKNAFERYGDYKKMDSDMKERVEWYSSLDYDICDIIRRNKEGLTIDGNRVLPKGASIDDMLKEMRNLKAKDNRSEEDEAKIKQLESSIRSAEYACVEECNLAIMANQYLPKTQRKKVIQSDLKKHVPSFGKRIYENTHKAMGDWDYIKSELDRRMGNEAGQ